MFLLLLNFLNALGLKVPLVFWYFSTRMILAAGTTLVLTIFLGPFFVRKLYELKIGQPIRTEKECPFLAALHSKKKDTPTMGGLLILCSMLIALFLWMDLTSAFTWILFITTVSLGFLGGLDDFLKLKKKSSEGMPSRYKFLGQILFAVAVATYLLCPAVTTFFEKFHVNPPIAKEFVGKTVLSTKDYVSRFYVPFIKKSVFDFNGLWTPLFFLFLVWVIVGSSNAVNLTDGLDGLASGCLILVASVFAIIAFFSNNIEIAKFLNILYIEGSGEIAVYLCAMIGASLGFLWYNSYPAQIFMGDTGSLALGGVIGVSAILLSRTMLLSLVGGIFVAEAFSVILQVLSYRYRNKKRIFLCSPLHHHFEYKGWAETKIVMRFWIVGLLLALLGIASLKFQ